MFSHKGAVSSAHTWKHCIPDTRNEKLTVMSAKSENPSSIQLITVSPRRSEEEDEQNEKSETFTFVNPTSLETDGKMATN